ncbi:leukocyte elastase inhibitor-like [Homarus americanus]|uniref:leukocyte elastase inhibitor-like n=1 Tax=Homarus americanus TaxID=6706 RepID=UPI001C46E780|nr:leukocyte elastase inhibitor-like [Homarus americanus]
MRTPCLAPQSSDSKKIWWFNVLMVMMLVTMVEGDCLDDDDDDQPSSFDLDTSSSLEFSVALFREVYRRSSPEVNVVFSPASVGGGLLLAYLASSGNTKHQLEEVLGLDDKLSALNTWRHLQLLWGASEGKKNGGSLVVVNKAYVDPRVRLNQCVADHLSHHELHRLSFLQHQDAAARINREVSESTRGRVGHLVDPQDLIGALMVLVNAAAFKGSWLYQFPLSNTFPARFYTSPTTYTQVAMMKHSAQLRYGVSPALGARLLELPYSGGSWSMFLLLPSLTHDPKHDLGLDDLTTRLTADSLRLSINNMWYRQVKVEMPKFKLDYAIKDDLKQALHQLGIRDLFSKRADLTALAPFGGLLVSRSLHQASLEVTEEGTEAAAATAFISHPRTKLPPPVTFQCNRPFLFFIYDNLSNSIIFIGIYSKPDN